MRPLMMSSEPWELVGVKQRNRAALISPAPWTLQGFSECGVSCRKSQNGQAPPVAGAREREDATEGVGELCAEGLAQLPAGAMAAGQAQIAGFDLPAATSPLVQ